MLFYVDKLEKIMRACDNLLGTWRTHGSPLGDRKVKEITYRTIFKTADELEQWRHNSSTDDNLTSLNLTETSLDEIRDTDTAILREEEEADIDFPSLLKLLITKTRIFGNNSPGVVVRVSIHPPPLIEKRGEL